MRHNDPDGQTRSYFRSAERVLLLNGQWFYATREGEVGPFPTREEALREVDRFVRERRELDRFQRVREQESLQTSARVESLDRVDSWEVMPLEDADDMELLVDRS